MSNVYILEPPTSGKVLLKTTVGDIDVELWAKETPKTCRNFVQLCLEGYYNNTIFHRVVKNFIAQGGDPKGDGTGGESIYGAPFKDEFHSRLRFARRGLLAMANAGKDDNASQFFFTLAPTPELQDKHTIFGKVTGETVFNMLKLEDGLIERERPAYPHKILKTEVLNNPFPDIEPRLPEKSEEKSDQKKEKKAGVKNFKLLSFGEEAEEDEEQVVMENEKFSGKSKSTHDVLNDPKLSTKTDAKKKKARKDSDEESSEESDGVDHELELQNIRKKLTSDKKRPSTSYYLNKDHKEAQKRKAEKIREEIKKVKKEYQVNKKATEELKKLEAKTDAEKNDTFKEYSDEVCKYKEMQRKMPAKGKSREQFTLDLLAKFKKKLEAAKEKSYEEETKKEVEKKEEEKVEEKDESWLTHELKFETEDPVLAKDANTKGDDWFEIYDPRNPLNKRRRGEKSDVKNAGNKT